MKAKVKFSKEYHQNLKNNKKSIEQYLQNKTGYQVQMDTELNPEVGWCYTVKLSVDNFKTFTKLSVLNTSKAKIKQEIVTAVLTLDFKHKTRSLNTKTIRKRVLSSALRVFCYGCHEELPVVNFHHGKHSEFLRPRRGYSLFCSDCAMAQFSAIHHRSGFELALLWLCAFYDSAFVKDLCITVKEKPLTPVAKAKEYFRLLNLIKHKGVIFADTDLLQEFQDKTSIS